MSLAATIAGALGAAAAAWLSTATLGFTGASGVRLAILPVSVPVLLLAVAAATAVVALRRAGASLLPLVLLVFLLLPWLPLSVPSAFLLWVWPLSLFLWIAVLLLMIVSIPEEETAIEVGDPRAAPRRGRDGGGDLRAVGLGRGADDPRRRRAALSDHHAEPAARSLADDRKRASPRRLPRLLRR